MDTVWDGITQVEGMTPEVASVRHALADAGRQQNWDRLIDLISKNPNLANICRLGGSSLFAPLHQAAYGGAAIEVVERLLKLGAWRTLQNDRGERPIDVACRQGHLHLTEVLTPVYKRDVPLGVLLRIQSHFHAVIHARIDQPLPDNRLRLPELEILLEIERPHMWFAVPGMYGGFSYRLEAAGVGATLVSESWCRVVEGSGQRHVINSAGSKLIDEGFV